MRGRRLRNTLLGIAGVAALIGTIAGAVAVDRHRPARPPVAAGTGSPGPQGFLTVPSDAVDPGDLAAPLTTDVPSTLPPAPGAAALQGVPGVAPPPVVAGAHAVNVPILMYHFLRVDSPLDRLGFALSTTPANFALQLAYLRREGFTTVSLGDVMNALTSGAKLPRRPIVLTFDDGFQNFATVGAPLLAREGFTATAYVVSGFVGRPQYMSATQVRDVVAMGMTVGAHTEHHVDLTREPLAVARQEIDGSRAALRALTGQPVLDFAYPAGRFDPQVVQLVEEAGFRDAVTTLPGIRLDADQRFVLPRVRVFGGETITEFARSIVGAASVAAVAAAAGEPVQPASPAPPVLVGGAPPPRRF